MKAELSVVRFNTNKKENRHIVFKAHISKIQTNRTQHSTKNKETSIHTLFVLVLLGGEPPIGIRIFFQ